MSAFTQICLVKVFCLENCVYINEYIILYNKSIIKYNMAFYLQGGHRVLTRTLASHWTGQRCKITLLHAQVTMLRCYFKKESHH